jgi:sugar phosphate isomerase/epimerase
MKLATTTSDFSLYTSSQKTAIELIRRAGFKYADYSFEVDYTRRSGIYSDDREGYIEDIRRTEDMGIRLVQAHSPMGSPLKDDGQFLDDTVRCVYACSAWGIPNLVVHSGYLEGLSREETLVRNRDFFLRVLEHAERCDVNILVENFNKMGNDGLYWIDNAPDLLAMVEAVKHPLFHAVWDVGHANMQEMPQHEALQIVGKHVLALHIHDNMGGSDSHLTPFLGSVDWDSVMYGLSRIGYDGYFTFEIGSVFSPADKRRAYTEDGRLKVPPIELRCAYERYIYELGKCILEKYGCFEE